MVSELTAETEVCGVWSFKLLHASLSPAPILDNWFSPSLWFFSDCWSLLFGSASSVRMSGTVAGGIKWVLNRLCLADFAAASSSSVLSLWIKITC